MTITPADNIQAKINSSAEGETITFSAGTYNVPATINLKGNRKYISTSGAILKGQPSYHIFKFTGDDITIDGITFDGKCIHCDKPSGKNNNITINNCVFRVNATGEGYNGINVTSGLSNSKITNCSFSPINGDNGIYGYNWDNLTIANNEFLNGNEGIHLVDFGGSKNLLIEQNYFSGLRRMGCEIQGGGDNTIVQDNYYESPAAFTNDTMCFSIINDKATNPIVRRNYASMPTSANSTDKIGVRIIFELGGTNLLCEGNYSSGGNHVIAVNGTNATGFARNNRLSNFREAPRNANGASVQFSNNTATTALTWDIKRGRPYPNKRYGQQPSSSSSSQASKYLVRTSVTFIYSDGSTETVTRA